MWEALCRGIGKPELITDPRFARGGDRRTHSDALREEIGAWMLERNKFEVMRILGGAGVPCSAVYDSTDVFRDPHLKSRDFFVSIEHPVKGKYTQMRSPIRMTASKVDPGSAPLVGEHSREVLSKELGLEDAEIDNLLQEGVIAAEGTE